MAGNVQFGPHYINRSCVVLDLANSARGVTVSNERFMDSKEGFIGLISGLSTSKVDPIAIMLPARYCMGDYASDGEEDGSSSVTDAVGGGIDGILKRFFCC